MDLDEIIKTGLEEKRFTWDYYYNNYPLEFQNDENIIEHFVIFFKILTQQTQSWSDIIKGFELFESNYEEYLNSMDKGAVGITSSDLLEKIGTYYGVNKDLTVSYEEAGVQVTKALHLNRNELLKLILVKVINASYNGTMEETENLYKRINLPIYEVCYTSGGVSIPGTAYMYFNTHDMSENLIDLFKAGELTLKSAGIIYTFQTVNVGVDLVWDSTNWDAVNWG